jgi:hypothetical protein
MTYYDELGVGRSAAPAEIRRAYVALARHHHPDAGGDPARMRALNAAFATLSDPQRRRRYDVDLRQAAAAGLAAPATEDRHGAWPAGPGPDGAGDDDLSGVDPADLLDDTPFGPPPARPSLVVVPPGLFALSLLSAALFFVFGHPALLAGAGALVFFAGIATAAVALLSLTRGARTTRMP